MQRKGYEEDYDDYYLDTDAAMDSSPELSLSYAEVDPKTIYKRRQRRRRKDQSAVVSSSSSSTKRRRKKKRKRVKGERGGDDKALPKDGNVYKYYK